MAQRSYYRRTLGFAETDTPRLDFLFPHPNAAIMSTTTKAITVSATRSVVAVAENEDLNSVI